VTIASSNTIGAESPVSFGSELRQLRKARRMTLKDLAAASGVSVSHLSAIERDAVSPSLNKVHQIAATLDVPVEWFFAKRPGAGPLERAYVVRAENRRELNVLYEAAFEDHSGVDTLLSSSLGGEFYMGITEYAPKVQRDAETPFQHEGEQHGLVLEGELHLRLENETILLRAGDSYSFPGAKVHLVTNESDAPAKLIWATSPVIISSHIRVTSGTD